MTDLARWQERNEAYLSAALAWLRSRLERTADAMAGGSEPREPEAPSPAGDSTDWAAGQLVGADEADPPPALTLLSQRLGLSRFERELLLLCAAMELDTRIAALCARAQGDPARPYPTFALALAILDEPAWDALSPERPLRFWRLIEIHQPGAQPLTASALRADERIVSYLKGLNYLDDRLSVLLARLESPETALAPSHRKAVANSVQHMVGAQEGGHAPLMQLVGRDSESKQSVARHAAAELGLTVFRLPAGSLPAHPAELETLARLWERESRLLPIALYLEAGEPGDESSRRERESSVKRFLARSNGVFFLDTREIQSDLGRSSAAVDVAKPTPTEQREAWASLLGSASRDLPPQLAGQFDLSLPSILRAAQSVRVNGGGNGRALDKRLWEACLASARPRLEALTQRLVPKAAWEDIVLPEEQIALLRQIADQARGRSQVYEDWGFARKMNRGLGITALFAGESGTGKTMAAEVIAQELRLDLYRIDLSSVVSKYIGETEKNLRRLFDAAEDGGAILFFDEADALFGKRSEVKDSHDRYANIEINYLLQRMEAYRGLAILATNMKNALDPAFLRRIRFVVSFPFPGPKERRAIWWKAFPPETPTEGLDCERLAHLNLTGGSIHNIALNAAFLAVRAGGPVSMPLVLRAVRAEFRKLEKPINEAELRWQARP